MNLQTILAIMGIVLFVISMVRGCGGMMSGGRGMGSRSADQRRPHDQQEGADMKQSPEPVGTKSWSSYFDRRNQPLPQLWEVW
jgi:hypothetical protein